MTLLHIWNCLTTIHYRTSSNGVTILAFILLTFYPFSHVDGKSADLIQSDQRHALKVSDWTEFPPLPNAYGYSGAFIGVSGDSLLFAGGSNWPFEDPWGEESKKTYYDHVLLLEDPGGDWKPLKSKIPYRTAHGVSDTWRGHVVCAGGESDERVHDEVYLLWWDGTELHRSDLANMPAPSSQLSGAVLGDTLYVCGGGNSRDADLKTFWSLDLSQGNEGEWKQLTPWPNGPSRKYAVTATLDGKFYLFGGLNQPPGSEVKFLKDSYRYTPGEGWEQLADMPRAATAAPSPTISVSGNKIIIIGGVTGQYHENRFELKENHPGFPETIMAYDVESEDWITWGTYPKYGEVSGVLMNEGLWPPVTTSIVNWRGFGIVVGGEIKPRIRSPKVIGINLE